MKGISQRKGFRRNLGISIAATIVGSMSLIGASVLSEASPAGATTPAVVQGTACGSFDATNNSVCQDSLTGSGFTPGGLVNVIVFEQSPALTGPYAAGGKNVMTTQVTASSLPQPCGRLCLIAPGSIALTYDNPNDGCNVKYLIEAQDVTNPGTWATSAYTSSICLR